MKTKINLTVIGLALVSSLNGATSVHELGDLSAVTSDFTIVETSADETTADLIYSVTGATVGGEAFTYTFTIAAGTGVTDLTTAGANMGQTGSANNQFDHGDQITLTVSDISNANVVFDGYVGFGVNFGASGIGYNIAGTDYIQGSGTDPRFGAAPDSIVASSSALVTYLNNFDNDALASNLRGVALQFSSIPEPSSYALLAGCFGLASVMLRRRRA